MDTVLDIFYHYFTFNLFVSWNLCVVYLCRQHIGGSWIFNPVCQSLPFVWSVRLDWGFAQAPGAKIASVLC